MTTAKSATVRALAAATKKSASAPATPPSQLVVKVTAAAKPAKPIKPIKTPVVAKTKVVKNKPEKVKPVRDSFTFPKNEYLVIDVLKKRAVALGHPSKKSELLRAGIKALSVMSDTAFAAAIRQVPAIKTGRPGKG